jgi:hypothetical protein
MLTAFAMLRLLVNGPLADGQLLNFAAAVVCPRLTRPPGTCTGLQAALRYTDRRDRGIAPYR